FFFQAEDGIRDRNVTGVQTCALPISRLTKHCLVWRTSTGPSTGWKKAIWSYTSLPQASAISTTKPGARCATDTTGRGKLRGGSRSEERRVGKEWRSGGAGDE